MARRRRASATTTTVAYHDQVSVGEKRGAVRMLMALLRQVPRDLNLADDLVVLVKDSY